MKFTIDTEFNGFGGELLSLALVPWDDYYPSLYLRVPDHHHPGGEGLEPWVSKNVWPYIASAPVLADIAAVPAWASTITQYLSARGGVPYIIADWPDDIRYFCQTVITGPGEMPAALARLQFDMVRVDPYEAGSAPPGAVRHNAWWDAVALRDHLKLHTKGEY
jgi:hypothetical protein